MKDRYQRVKDEIMYLINLSPEAMHSIGGMHERLKDKVTRTEIERAVACLLARQHIKKLGAYVFGFGTGEDIKPYDLTDHDPNALPVIEQPDKSNKQKIAEAEQRRQQSAGKKTLQDWSTGNNKQEKQTVKAEDTPKPPSEEASNINYALDQLRDRLSQTRVTTVQDLPKKINTLEQLALILDPTIGKVLDQIKNDLKGLAA